MFVTFECQAPLHKRQAPPHKRKAPLLSTFWRRFRLYNVYVIVLALNYQRSNLKFRYKIHSTLRPRCHITTKISDCTLKQRSKTHSALRQRSLQLQKQSERMSLWIRAVEPRRWAPRKTHTKGCKLEITREWNTLSPGTAQVTIAETGCGSA